MIMIILIRIIVIVRRDEVMSVLVSVVLHKSVFLNYTY